jgi:sugar/nucleoside kinase (ribokinase family)
MKPNQLCGLGNALVDIAVELPEADFVQFGIERGSSRLVTVEEQQQLLSELQARAKTLCGGGSVANSLVAFVQLGGRATFLCSIGDDEYGRFFKEELETLGISTYSPVVQEGQTGTCVALVTPDAERSMRTSLGVSAALSEQHIKPEQIAGAEWLFIEGYVLANPSGMRAADRAIDCAVASGTKIALTVSDESIVHAFGHQLATILPYCDLLFANEKEAIALSGCPDINSAFKQIKSQVPIAAVTLGSKGVLVSGNGEECLVPSFPCVPVDTTGAGDMFAGVFLFCLSQGYSVRESARRGCFLAARVISSYGARIKGDLKEIFDSIPALESGSEPADLESDFSPRSLPAPDQPPAC